MANQGYIKLYRKIKEKSWWLRRTEKATWTQAWVDLLLRTNHKDADIILDGTIYKVQRGSCIVSQRKLAEEWNWGIARVNAFFKFLANNEQSIRYETEHCFTHIFILNWEKYQAQVEHQPEQKRNTDGTPAETNNNDKNDNNEKKNVSFLKESKIDAYKRGERWGEIPHYKNEEMRWVNRKGQWKWEIIPEEGGRWLEFGGKDSEIEWRLRAA